MGLIIEFAKNWWECPSFIIFGMLGAKLVFLAPVFQKYTFMERPQGSLEEKIAISVDAVSRLCFGERPAALFVDLQIQV